MERKFGVYIILGLLIGIIFGMGLGTANGNTIWGIAVGGLAGTFLGWFVATVALEQGNTNNKKK
jgi:hypothetical protein